MRSTIDRVRAHAETPVLRPDAVRLKSGSGGAVVDFDAVYSELIKPAVQAAGLVPLRADEEQAGGSSTS
jgi:hypothetical protein